MSDIIKKRVRGGGREARRELRSSNKSNIGKPFITREVPIYDLISDEVAELIESNADTILEEIGKFFVKFI